MLTSNHVLSIWAPGACPGEWAQWARELVVNKLLRSGRSREDDRRSQRVRAFAFGRGIRFGEGDAADGGTGDICFYLLSLVNDLGEVFVVRISSPFDSSLQGRGWSATILARCQIAAFGADDRCSLRSSVLSVYLASNALVDQLAWSDWYRGKDGTFLSALALMSTRVHCCRLRASLEDGNAFTLNVGIEDGTTLQDVDVYNGPAGWVPRTFLTTTSPLLYCFGKHALHFIEVSLSDISYAKKFEYGYDDRWDIVAGTGTELSRLFSHSKMNSKRYHPGVAFCWTSSDTFEMYTATHTYRQTSNNLRISLSKDGTQLLETGNNVWTSEVISHLSHFKAEHYLRSDPFVRIWGMASSPLGDYICTSYSLHPSSMLEYVIPAEQLCFLRITPANKLSSNFCMPLVMSSALSSGGFP